MHHPLNIVHQISRIPHRLYWEIVVHIPTILFVAWLYLVNRYRCTPITGNTGPVVSLTTYGKRIGTVFLAIESIGRGRVLPSRLILWVDESSILDKVPMTIWRLKQRGLEVKICQNYGPHKKYYPYVKSHDSFDAPLVTADDDILYPSYWLEQLVDAFQEAPANVNCFRARVVQLSDEGVAGFSEWKRCKSTKAHFRHHAIGDSGVIYPPALLTLLKQSGSYFENCCPKADDIWLHVQALRGGFKVRQIHSTGACFRGIPNSQTIGLYKENLAGGNDRQIKATYTADDIRLLLNECIILKER
jgi:hypothetical protein